MIQGYQYHSCLAEAPEVEPCTEVKSSRIHAFTCDLSQEAELPRPYAAVDVFYFEPPWESRGAKTFYERAGLEPPGSFLETVLAAINLILNDPEGRPVYLVAGRWVGNRLPEPDVRRDIKLWGAGKDHRGVKALLFGFNIPRGGEGEGKDTLEFLRWLAGRYDRVGDPFCGCGTTGRVFVEAGKRATLSDVNPRCIGVIAEAHRTWGFRLQ